MLNNPVYLDKEHTLGTFESLHSDNNKKDDNDAKPQFKYHYAISAWFNINPQPSSTRISYSKYTNILNYGDKPRIQFHSVKNTFRIQVKKGHKYNICR